MRLSFRIAVYSATLLALAALSACGGNNTPARSNPAPDFTLTATPSTATIAAGAKQTVSVKATPANGFSSAVSVALTGLPAGVTASPSTLTLTPGTAQTLTLTAASSAGSSTATISFAGSAGSLTHTASVSLTVTAASSPDPDFSLTLNPASLALTAGAGGQSVSISANALNSFTGVVAIAVSGLPSGVTATPTTLTLNPGAVQSITFTAAAGAASSTGAVTLTGASGSLNHTAALALTVQTTSTPPPAAAPDVVTYHYNNARDGLNTQETILTPANVNSSKFGKIGSVSVDGHVDAQPLFVANLAISSQSRNVLYVATEHGSLYAFDADAFTQLWKVSLIPSGESPSDDHGCNQISPEIGITSTPVIDRTHGPHGAIFAVATSKDGNGSYHQRLHAIDIATGAQLQTPAEIAATYPGSGANSLNGNVVFDPAAYAERAALLMLNGDIYTAWTSHCDQSPYTGWILAYDASTLQQSQVLNITPNGAMGAIWMAGDGLAADSAGSIYLLDGNGSFDTSLTNGFPSQGDYGNAILRLTTQPKLQVADYFESYDTTAESDADEDLGSGGLILLPDLKDANGVTRQLLVGAGKDGAIYLADRANMGRYDPSSSTANSNLYQYLSNGLGSGSFATPAYFNGVLYYGPVNRPLLAFSIAQARIAASPQSASAATFAYPGTTPSISANGSSNAIVWALESNTGNAAVLHAYDPADLAHEYYNSNQASAGRDSFGAGNKYIAPVVVNGKVYVGTSSGVAIFGLLKP
ncbi:MAG TPA: hypothetical protein VIM62_01850 [Acidobacteriaceae bacterium]